MRPSGEPRGTIHRPVRSSGGASRRASARPIPALVAALALVAAQVPAAWVRAQEPELDASAVARRVEVLSAEGVEAYKSGRYREALARFKAALALSPVANLLFNIARIHEKLGELSEAITYYERYERAPDAEPAARDAARERLADLRAQIAARAATVGPTNGGPHDGTHIVDTGGPSSGPSALGTAGWILVGVGGATTVTGGVLGGLALGAQSSFDSATAVNDKRAYRDDAKTLALSSDVTIGVGAAALVAGLVLVIVDATSEPPSTSGVGAEAPPSFVVAPSVGDGGGGVQALVTF